MDTFSNINAFMSLNEVPVYFQDRGFYQDLEISGFNTTVQTRYTHTHGFHEWRYTEEHFFRASCPLPFPAFLSQSLSHLHKSSWEAQGTPAVWQCHRFHVVLQDDYLAVISSRNTLSCIKALQLPVFHVTTGTDPSTSGFIGRAFLALARQKKNADYD